MKIRRFTVKVSILVWVSEEKWRVMQRDMQTSFVPRVGDSLFGETWGLAFFEEGCEVEHIGIGVDDEEIVVWLKDDLDSWKDGDDMLDKCYHGFMDRDEKKPTSDPLKPCPFCGEQAKLDGMAQGLYAVVCTECLAATYWRPQKHVAIDIWNKRSK